MRVYAGTLSTVEFMRQGGGEAVAVHSTLPINLGRASGKLKCDDVDLMKKRLTVTIVR